MFGKFVFINKFILLSCLPKRWPPASAIFIYNIDISWPFFKNRLSYSCSPPDYFENFLCSAKAPCFRLKTTTKLSNFERLSIFSSHLCVRSCSPVLYSVPHLKTQIMTNEWAAESGHQSQRNEGENMRKGIVRRKFYRKLMIVSRGHLNRNVPKCFPEVLP